VTWTLSNGYLHDATVQDLKTTPVPVTDLVDGLAIPHRTSSTTVGTIVFTQRVPGDAREASVSFSATGPDIKDVDRDNTDIVTMDGSCKKVEAPCVKAADATFHHTFAIEGDRAVASIGLDDGVKLCADEHVTLASYFAPRPQFAVPQYLYNDISWTLTNTDRSVNLAAALPGCDTQVDLFFGGEDDVLKEITADGPRYGDRKLGSSTGLGARSKGPQAWFNGAQGGAAGCRQPAVEPAPLCDGSINVHLSNTGDISKFPVDFTVTAGGGFHRTVTVAPGQAETVPVPAGAGQVTVTADGLPTKTFTWERPDFCKAPTVAVHNDCDIVTVTVTNRHGPVPAVAVVSYGREKKPLTVAVGQAGSVTFKPGTATSVTVDFRGLGLEPVTAMLAKVDCPAGSGGAGGSGGAANGGLPITGAAGGAIAGGAAVLLGVGGALFFLARRRRIKFTA
jgi:hypothetical protein